MRRLRLVRTARPSLRVGRLIPPAMAGLEEWSSPRKGTEFGLRLTATFLALGLTMASYLVTGGAGFIGSHLAAELVRRGHRVRVVDSLVTGKRCNLDHVSDVDFVEGDLADNDVARRGV